MKTENWLKVVRSSERKASSRFGPEQPALVSQSPTVSGLPMFLRSISRWTGMSRRFYAPAYPIGQRGQH